jgi:hypothetical protein
MNEEQLKERYSRQQDIVPSDRIAACKATVVGVGAIGRQVALQLAAIGIPWLQLIDFDIVETSNLASQGYLEGDLGRPKVEATSKICRQINGGLELHQVNDRFRRSMAVGNAVFCCVDKIDTRKLVWQAVKNKVNFFCDGRMSAEVIRVLTACDYESRKYYPTTLFAPQEAYAGPCTGQNHHLQRQHRSRPDAISIHQVFEAIAGKRGHPTESAVLGNQRSGNSITLTLNKSIGDKTMSEQNVTVRKAYRQGELLFVPLSQNDLAVINYKPTNQSSSNWRKLKTMVLREGEATGHKHEIVAENSDAVAVLEPTGQFVGGLEDMDSVGHEDRMIVADEPVQVVHPEHKPLNLPKGHYLVLVQREYDETRARRVMD